MAEGSETPGGGLGPEQPGGIGRRGEGDLLAERRARRAAESGEQALARRAEAAEATVRTLEAHVASLQRRLDEADRSRTASYGSAEQPGVPPSPAAGAPRTGRSMPEHPGLPAHELAEQELRRARQREYAEQRQRQETEDRMADIERENGAEVERLRRRLSDSEGEAGMLAGRLQQLRRELAEAEQTLAAERLALRQLEAELRASVAELEQRATAAERELDSERAAREQAERELEGVRAGHRTLEGLLADLRDAAARLREAAENAAEGEGPTGAAPGGGAPAGGPIRPPSPAGHAEPSVRGGAPQAPVRNGEMVEALAAAVDRLRARMADGGTPGGAPAAEGAAAPRAAQAGARASEPAPERERLQAPARAILSPGRSRGPGVPSHKHSMSLIGRVRLRRKQRQRH
jgi:hypothetical protein